ncbi:MAG: 4'-phosphopantetheinyl transferase superfamily protein [Oscillospiraceae bacterium]|nr:4'-phosphopantetheinyl transferase superfamily protein [Oscillospiraceae bacterium]
MAEQVDFTACVVSGGVELLERINSAREEYSPLCGGYFDYLSGKYGKPTFRQSACGFILLDGLLQKNGIDRRSLDLARNSDGRPCVINRRDVDLSISHSEGAALACLAVGENAGVGADIQRVRNYSREHLERLARSFMDETELSGFLESGDRERYFYTLWTRREAFYKRCGSYYGFGGSFSTGIITACGRLYYYSISQPGED